MHIISIVPLLALVSADTLFFRPHKQKALSVVCPDKTTECPTGNTCCKLSSAEYGCCPLPNAVCCKDDKHCCPQDYTCDAATAACTKGKIFFPWVERIPKKKKESKSNELLTNLKNVVCPDGQSQCPDGHTCCKLSSGQYGCCPLASAVCCSDGVHCCPSGTTCDVSAGTCSRDGVIMDWFDKRPAMKSSAQGAVYESKANELLTNLRNVVCPDGQSQCPDGHTCCKLSSGQYGCCPLASAVCCSDGVHCCPSGTTCDVSAGTCSRDGVIMDWFDKRPAMKSFAQAAVYESNKLSANLKEVVCPDGQSQCPDGNTCCKLSSGQFGCCPLPNAVCCSDGQHCCPSGSTCHTAAGKCSKNGVIMDWFDKRPAMKSSAHRAVHESNELPAKLKNVVCPDGQSQCPDGHTCCKLSSGQFGCCPLPNAVCCSDGQHCCPSGSKCDASAGKCTTNGVIMDWFDKKPAMKSSAQGAVHESNELPANLKNVVCPDGQSQCPDSNTCCKSSSGRYGCCPLPKAVCCSDGQHCCPSGYKCDLSVSTCKKGGVIMDWFEKRPAMKSSTQGALHESNELPAKLKDVVCPDGQSQCPDGNTCCKLSSGQFGCCPIPNAVCCSDGQHCCPSGYTCDVSAGTCQKGDVIMDWFEKRPAMKSPVQDVICPDGMSKCPTGNTCCKTASGSWGCCPLVQAVCCSDHIHCCPQDTTCDVSQGKCDRGDVFVSNWVEKQPAKQKNVICPDGMSECPTGNTCCKTASGSWGCCPLPQAVCCKDKKHCCPQGYSCDTTTSQCIKGRTTLPWLDKVPAQPLDVSKKDVLDVICPDGETSCTTSQTCCELSSGKYGCCPVPNAVCCSDGKHCCPSGNTCNVTSGQCQSKDAVMDWLEKRPALRSVARDVICPDGEHQCSSDQTCCKLSSGEYGCCPLPNAVCCSDGKHCCPSGHTCNVTSGQCQSKDAVMDWLEKQPALRSVVGDVICPDGEHQCSSDQTCCKLSSGEYGCCPLPNAVCCSDGQHCCPSGEKCNMEKKKCTGNNIIMDWFEKQPARKVKVRDIVCNDNRSVCPDNHTCCKLASGEYGCCPSPNAVCCADMKNCCPENYRCDGKQCVKKGRTTKAMVSIVRTSSVMCPDGTSECMDGQTCCLLTTGQYGCCSVQSAVCCSDHIHCCPSGYTCNLTIGACVKEGVKTLSSSVSLMAVAAPLKPGIQLNDKTETPGDVDFVLCKDNVTNCPANNTCCEKMNGGYVCCAYAKGVCCTNSDDCCPHGYVCDEEPKICRIPEKKAKIDYAQRFLQKILKPDILN